MSKVNSIGAVLKNKRIEQGLQQVEVAKHLNASQGTISKYERDSLPITNIHWLKLCLLFKLDPFLYLESKFNI